MIVGTKVSFGPEYYIKYGVNVAVFSASADQTCLTLPFQRQESDEYFLSGGFKLIFSFDQVRSTET